MSCILRDPSEHRRLAKVEAVRQTIEVEQFVQAPRDRVWAQITDHCAMNRWLVPGARIRLDPEGRSERNGTGAVRVIESAGLAIVEEIIDFEAPSRFSYTLRRGFPITDHLGTITLDETERGTRVEWTIEFRSKVPGLGGIMAFTLRRVIRRGLSRFARMVQ